MTRTVRPAKSHRETKKAGLKMVSHRHTIEKTMFMNEKGQPQHRIEHHTHTSYELPKSEKMPRWQKGMR